MKNKISSYLISLFFLWGIGCGTDSNLDVFTSIELDSLDASISDVLIEPDLGELLDTSTPDDVSFLVDTGSLDIDLTDAAVLADVSVDSSVDIVNSSPELKILFPPPNATVDFDTVIVRGTAKDADDDDISYVRINGIEAISEDGYATWELEVSLQQGMNQLDIEIADAENTASQNSMITKLCC